MGLRTTILEGLYATFGPGSSSMCPHQVVTLLLQETRVFTPAKGQRSQTNSLDEAHKGNMAGAEGEAVAAALQPLIPKRVRAGTQPCSHLLWETIMQWACYIQFH